MAQSEAPLEVIIISDGSADDTIQVARQLKQDWPIIRVIELVENVGPGRARDIAITAARGKYIALLDDDDEWISDTKLQTQRQFLEANKNYVLIGASRIEILSDSDARVSIYEPLKDDSEIRELCLLRNSFITSSLMFPLQSYLRSGGFPDRRLAEDYELTLRLLKVGKAQNLDGCDVRYYSREQGAHLSGFRQMKRASLEIIKTYRHDFPNGHKALLKAYARIIDVELRHILRR